MRCAGLGLVLIGALLSGCASVPVTGVPGGVDFRVSGTLAVRAPTGNFSARFRWIQAGTEYDLELWGAFGQGRHRLAGNDQMVRILDGKGDVLLAGPVRDMMLEQLGFALPLAALAYWIQGQPDPGQPRSQVSRHAGGEVAGFDQADWRIRYPAYLNGPGARRLPRVIEAASRDYQIKLALSRWEV